MSLRETESVLALVAENESLRQQLAEAQTTLAHAAQIKGMDDQLIAASLKREVDALAACKLKDEELEKIRGHIGLYNLFSCVGSDSYDPECADLNVGKCREIATKALTIQPDDSALKTWLGEPVGAVLVDRESHEGIMFYSNDMIPDPSTLKDRFELIVVCEVPKD